MKGISEIIATILMLMITLAISGTAYLFISGAFTQQTQGLEIVDAFCFREATGENATMILRNLGTISVDVSSVTVSQTAPSTAVQPRWDTSVITPGSSATLYDECEGSGSRSCIYRIIPPVGRSIVAAITCT